MKVCIVCENAYPFRSDASSKIAYHLAKEFCDRKLEVSVVCKNFSVHKYKEFNYKGIKYHVIKSDTEYKYSFNELSGIYRNNLLKNIFSKTRLFFLKLFKKRYTKKPFCSFKERKFFSFFKNNQFDLTIVIAGNFELSKLIESKTINTRIAVLYATDYWNKPNSEEDISNYLFKTYDYILGRDFYLGDKELLKFNDKYISAGPIIEQVQRFDQKQYDKISLSYFGSLYGVRDTDKFLDIVEQIGKQIEEVSVSIFTNASVDSKKYRHVAFKKEKYGDKYISEVDKTNVLLVLDNKSEYAKWVPSKLYDAMSIGKPIVLFTNNPNSYSLKEAKKYDLFYVINYDKCTLNDLDNLKKFLQENYLKKSSLNFESIYKICDKKYIADKIIGVCKK